MKITFGQLLRLTTCIFSLFAAVVRSNDPVLYDLQFKTEVTDHLAKTMVTGKIRNDGEIKVETVIPPTAFITGYTIWTGEKYYESEVLSHEQVQKIKNGATVTNRGATIKKSTSVRNTNTFTHKIKVVGGKATFYLAYQEILQRQHSYYTVITNAFPPDFVENIEIKIKIQESVQLTKVEVLPFSTGASSLKTSTNDYVYIDTTQKTNAKIGFHADLVTQKKIATELGNARKFGFQMIVRFDTEQSCPGGNIMEHGSYVFNCFVHCGSSGISKHVVFVLDRSLSMDHEQKIDELKKAMKVILPQVQPNDYITIIAFSENADVFTAKGKIDLTESSSDVASLASPENVKKISSLVQKLGTKTGTDIAGSLELGLDVVRKYKGQLVTDQTVKPMIIFLTDGMPDCYKKCVTEPSKMITSISEKNPADSSQIPIICLSLGEDADKTFLQKLAKHNIGFYRHIYAAKDISEQLEAFYFEISTLVLTDVSFSYFNAKTMTKTKFPRLFASTGLQMAVKKKSSGLRSGSDSLPTITAIGHNGPVKFSPIRIKPVGRLDNHWATLSVKQMLEARGTAKDVLKLDRAITNIALHYNFTTPLTTLVVRGPDGEEIVQPEKLSESGDSVGFSVTEKDFNLDEFIEDRFSDPVDDPASKEHFPPRKSGPPKKSSERTGSGTLRQYSSGLLVFLSSTFMCCVIIARFCQFTKQ